LDGDKNGAAGKADMPYCGAYVRFSNWPKADMTEVDIGFRDAHVGL
jgi:hypothetical protein